MCLIRWVIHENFQIDISRTIAKQDWDNPDIESASTLIRISLKSWVVVQKAAISFIETRINELNEPVSGIDFKSMRNFKNEVIQ